MKMKALRWHGPDDVRLDEVDVPPGPDGQNVRVRVSCAGVCTSDIHIARGLFGGNPPMILGHEISGIVTECGPGVANLRAGDRVALQPTIFCGECSACSESNIHLCENRKFPGIDMDGGFAAEMIAPERNWFGVDVRTDMAHACMVEPLACVCHALDRLNPPEKSRIAITGAGASAYLFLEVLKSRGIDPAGILVSGRRDGRLNLCKTVGARVVDVRKQDFAEACVGFFGARGPDILILQTGGEELMRESLDIVARKGTIFVYDYMGLPVPFDFGVMQLREVSLLTSTGAPPEAMTTALDIMASGSVNLAPLVTHVFPGSEADRAFSMSQSKTPDHVKTVIRYE